MKGRKHMNTEEMKQEIVKWAKREVELARQEQAIEAEAGAAMLDAEPDSGGDASNRRDSGLAELRAIAAAVREARRRRVEAIRAKRAAEAQGFEERRADLEEEHAALSARVEKHRKALTDLLGVEVAIMSMMPGTLSRQQALQGQIGNLTDKVAWLQGAAIPTAGAIDVQDATSVEALIDELATFEGAIPPMQRLLDWAKSCEPVPGETFGAMPRSFHLVWANGEIDCQQSTVFVEGLCSPGPIGMYSNRPKGIDVASGTFRARAATRP
jgi:hypothetical protein